jgi:hypothetical protein
LEECENARLTGGERQLPTVEYGTRSSVSSSRTLSQPSHGERATKRIAGTPKRKYFGIVKMNDLRTLHQACPFRPFAIHTANGRTFPIPHSEFLAYDPEGTTAVAFRTNHTFSVLDIELITELEILPRNGKSKPRAKK